MAYTKITLEVVIHEDDSEVMEQALNDAMDKIEALILAKHGIKRASPVAAASNGVEEKAAPKKPATTPTKSTN